MDNSFKELDINTYYRKGVFQHFSNDCKSSVSITSKIDVSHLIDVSKKTSTKFYINFLYCLGATLNSRDDYKMVYDWKNNKVLVYDKINVTHYVFNQETETCTPVYTEFDTSYKTFYARCLKDIEEAKIKGGYNLDMANHVNYFDASYISWLSYDALHIELPDGHLWFQPIINWGRYFESDGKFLMPLTVRLNHAVADGYLVSKVFSTLENVMKQF